MTRLGSSPTNIKPPSATNISPRDFARASSGWIRLQVRLLMGGYALALRLAGFVARRPRPLPPDGYDILLTGTFFSDNWVRSHLLPLAASDRCRRVRMVATSRVPEMPKVEGLYPPAWLMKVAGELPARLLYFVWIALRSRPHVVGGFHVLVNGLLAPLLGRLIGAKSLYFCVGGPLEVIDGGIRGGHRVFSRMGGPQPDVERRLLDAVRACDLVITMGTGAVRFFRERGLENAFHVVSGGIDPQRFQPSAAAAEFDLIVTCRLVPIKRLDLFLRVVQRLATDLPHLRAVIVGDGPLRETLEAETRDLGIERNVTFVGQQAAVEDWLRRSRIFVLTSDSEGLSLSLMEAMMSGLPAVVSAVGDLGDLVTDGVNGYLVAERSPEAFADRLRLLLTDPARLERFARAAAHAGAANTPAAVTLHWDAILSELDGGQKRPRQAPSRALSRKNLWEHAPAPVKATIGSIIGLLPPPAILGPRFTRQLRFLEEAQWWTEEQSRAYQLTELRRLCQHAYDNTPFYQRIFRSADFDPRDLKSPEDLAGLPTLDRATLRTHLSEMCAVPVPSRHVDYVSTGGSSGEPLHFYIDSNRSSIEYAYLVSGWKRAGFSLGTPMAVLRGRVVRGKANGLRHEYDPLLRHHYYSSFHLTANDISRYLDHIASIGPCFLHVYPSSVAAVARYLKGTGRRGPSNIIGILAESEIVHPQDHALVQETFGCRYSASYGLTEKVAAATCCEHSADYHVWPTYGYFELLDDMGRQVTAPGESGEIVATGFINKAVPFIRYRTGDRAVFLGNRCSACGRAHTIIGEIHGRRPREFLVAKDRSLIAWTALNMHDDSFDRVLRFQFHQDTPGHATLNIVPADGFSAADVARIRHNLEAKLDGALILTIKTVESIPLSVVGKAVYVDQRLPVSP